MSATRDAALQTIDRAGEIYLSLQDQQRFAAELIDPSPLAPAVECAIQRHKELVDPVD